MGLRAGRHPEGLKAAVSKTGSGAGAGDQLIRTRKPCSQSKVAGHHAAACAHMVNESVKARRMVEWDFAREELRHLNKPRLMDGGNVWREEGQDATIVHFWHFLNSIRTRKPYWQNELAGHHAAACAHMVNESVKTGRMVEWDFARDDIRGA